MITRIHISMYMCIYVYKMYVYVHVYADVHIARITPDILIHGFTIGLPNSRLETKRTFSFSLSICAYTKCHRARIVRLYVSILCSLLIPRVCDKSDECEMVGKERYRVHGGSTS